MLDHIGKMDRHTKCNNFIHEPAVRNAHLASTAAEHQYNFHTYLGSARTPGSVYVARLQIRARFWFPLDKRCSIAIMLSWTTVPFSGMVATYTKPEVTNQHHHSVMP